jgi:hypothetical protein
MHLVVLRDLPESRETLLLRLLGAGTTFRRAMKELHALPPDAWEAELAIPLLLAFRVEFPQDSGEDEMNYADELQAIYEQWEQRVKREARDEGRDEGWREGHDEGRDEGWREGRLQTVRDDLAAVYEARFGALPPALRDILAFTDSEETLRRWLGPFATRTPEEIHARVRAG